MNNKLVKSTGHGIGYGYDKEEKIGLVDAADASTPVQEWMNHIQDQIYSLSVKRELLKQKLEKVLEFEGPISPPNDANTVKESMDSPLVEELKWFNIQLKDANKELSELIQRIQL